MKLITAITSFSLALVMSASAALADAAPWEREVRMAPGHEARADQIHDVVRRLGVDYPGRDPRGIPWNAQKNKMPMANMSESVLRQLLTGHYVVMSFNGATRAGVAYYDGNGAVDVCYVEQGKYTYAQDPYHIDAAYSGFAGVNYSPASQSSEWGWTFTWDPRKEEVAKQNWLRGEWVPAIGFVQRDMPAFVVEACPQMPNSGRVKDAPADAGGIIWRNVIPGIV